jgi:hypothetical protein
LYLVVIFIGMNCATYEKGVGINLEPGQKPGAKLVNQKREGQQVKGELIAVKEKSLLLKESESGVDVSVDVREIKAIKIKKKSGALLGAGLGLIIGVGVGYEVGLSMEPKNSIVDYGFIGMLIGAPAGLLLGVAFGRYVLGADEKIQIEGASEPQIRFILEDLRKKARIPYFQ